MKKLIKLGGFLLVLFSSLQCSQNDDYNEINKNEIDNSTKSVKNDNVLFMMKKESPDSSISMSYSLLSNNNKSA